ncbi:MULTISPECIES: response regulator transcription factor [unclassified Brevundimonas]|uniref:response regulator transcription factor n=1 Tax=unclassified Brevundimonas TaxID=2622653 RepID=UPI0025B8E1F8|nr:MULTISPECIES: response regulator [unclassified Brevundimonas]
MTTLLIVDDSKLARIVVGKAIASLRPDWKKQEAGNADEALALIAEGEIDLAILDFNMPGRNGLELAADIRNAHPEMPIALATANVQDEIIAQARVLDVTFIPKPITDEGVKGFLGGAALKLRQRG